MRFRLFQLEGAKGQLPEPVVLSLALSVAMSTASCFEARTRFLPVQCASHWGSTARRHRLRRSWRWLTAAPPAADRSGAKWTVCWQIPREDRDTAVAIASAAVGPVSSQRCAGR